MNTITKRNRILMMLLTIMMIVTASFTISSKAVNAASAPPAPAKVKNFNATAKSDSKISLSWNKVQGAKGYLIEVKKNGEWTILATIKNKKTTTIKYQHKGLKGDTKYTYRIRAYKTYRTKEYRYYNLNTKKWQKKKPKSKYYKPCESGNFKGKKKRKVNVTDFVYSKTAAKTSATTKKPKTPEPVDLDPEFTNYSIPTREVYTIENQGAVTYTLSSKGAITWTTDDTKNTVTITTEYNGHSCNVEFNKTGTVTLTAKSETSGKTKEIIIEITSNIPPGSGGENDGGIDTDYGRIYPDEGTKKTFTVTKDDSSSVKISNVRIPASAIPLYLPDNSIIKIDAKNMIVKNPVTPNPDWTGTHSVDTQSGWITSEATSSNPNVATVLTNGIDVVSTGIYFIDAGETNITFSNGKVMNFIVTGRNDEVYNYINYVQSFISSNRGKTKFDIANSACALVSKIPYGPSNSALLTITNKYGNCYGKNFLLYRLLYEAGIDAKIHRVIPDKGDHRCLKVTIAGTTYLADATASDSLMSQSEYEDLIENWEIAEEETIRKIYKLTK